MPEDTEPASEAKPTPNVIFRPWYTWICTWPDTISDPVEKRKARQHGGESTEADKLDFCPVCAIDGRDEISLKITKHDPPSTLNIGMDRYTLPSKEEQLAGFYFADTTLLLTCGRGYKLFNP